jgi:hypothetical protein
MNSEDFAEYIAGKYIPDGINIDFESARVDFEDISKRNNPSLVLDYAGNADLLDYRPSNGGGISNLAEVNKDENKLIVQFGRKHAGYSPEEVDQTEQEIITSIKSGLEGVRSDISDYESRLRKAATKKHKQKKSELQRVRDRLDDLDVDIHRDESANQTVQIDEPERRKEISIDDVTDQDPLSPGISNETYSEILEAINSVGRGFEQSPATYEEFGEEDYRNVLLTFLDMNFEGSATGETFVKKGKSDVLLRHEGDNIFIGECAMWEGPGTTLSGTSSSEGKITQLLDRYLSWRDSKAAVILFVDRKNFSNVLEKIPDAVEQHEQYEETKTRKDSNWWQYSFDRPDDSGNLVDLAVMAFNVYVSN